MRSIIIKPNYKFDKEETAPQTAQINFSPLEGGKVAIYDYGDTLFDNKVIIVRKDSEAVNYDILGKDENGNVIITNKTDQGYFNDGSCLFVKTDDIQGIGQVYYVGLDYYIEDKRYDVIPRFLTADIEADNSTDQYALVLDSTVQDITFLINDHSLERDLSLYPLSEISSEEKGVEVHSYYSDNVQLAKPNHRIRIVISDSGRIITMAVWNTPNSKFSNVKTFIFPTKIEGNNYITLSHNANDSEPITNITANF